MAKTIPDVRQAHVHTASQLHRAPSNFGRSSAGVGDRKPWYALCNGSFSGGVAAVWLGTEVRRVPCYFASAVGDSISAA